MRIALVVVLLAGCVGRPLEPFTVSDLGEARDLDEPAAACTVPSAEETAAAVKLAWVALSVPGNAPRVVWTCNCRELDIWCRLFHGEDPLRITWYAHLDAEDRIVQPTRISESKLAFVLALHAKDHGAVLEPHAVGEEVNRVLAAAGY